MCYCDSVNFMSGPCPVCGRNAVQVVEAWKIEPKAQVALVDMIRGQPKPAPVPVVIPKAEPADWIQAYRRCVETKDLNCAALLLFQAAKGMDLAKEWIVLLDEVAKRRGHLLEREVSIRKELCLEAMAAIGFNPGKSDGPAVEVPAPWAQATKGAVA